MKLKLSISIVNIVRKISEFALFYVYLRQTLILEFENWRQYKTLK